MFARRMSFARRIAPRLRHTPFVLAALALSAFVVSSPLAVQVASANAGGYRQVNLVSDIAGVARITDPHLVNPWGISFGPTTPFWISDNGTGLSTLYNGNGIPFPPGAPLVVTIPPPAGSAPGTTAAPTGNVFNGTNDFVVSKSGHSGPSMFIFVTEDGTVSGWNPTVDLTHAILAADRSGSGAVYKGLAQGRSGGRDFLYAANFHAGAVDVFDAKFHLVHLAGSFKDPNLPAGYAPFGIRNIGERLYVTYALQNAAKHDDVAGPGHGFVDVFDTSGHLLRRFASRGTLNSPWGLALAPSNFGRFSNDLLVGNFGDGRINAFDPGTGAFLGQLHDGGGRVITIDGLWALTFGNGNNAGPTNTLFFTAGIGGEAHGLFGKIQAEN